MASLNVNAREFVPVLGRGNGGAGGGGGAPPQGGTPQQQQHKPAPSGASGFSPSAAPFVPGGGSGGGGFAPPQLSPHHPPYQPGHHVSAAAAPRPSPMWQPGAPSGVVVGPGGGFPHPGASYHAHPGGLSLPPNAMAPPFFPAGTFNPAAPFPPHPGSIAPYAPLPPSAGSVMFDPRNPASYAGIGFSSPLGGARRDAPHPSGSSVPLPQTGGQPVVTPPAIAASGASAAKSPQHVAQPSVSPPPPVAVATPPSMNSQQVSRRPLVVLLLGPRGAGKSTQSKILANLYRLTPLSSGELVRAGMRPLDELDRQLELLSEDWNTLANVAAATAAAATTKPSRKAARQRSTGGVDSGSSQPATSIDGESHHTAGSHHNGSHASSQQRASNGLVLDRFITDPDADPYYLLQRIHSNGMQLDLVINLMMDAAVGMDRATERDAAEVAAAAAAAASSSPPPEGDAAAPANPTPAARPVNNSRRLQEHLAVYESCVKVFRPYGALHNVDCDDKTVDAVSKMLCAIIDNHLVQVKSRSKASERHLPAPPELAPGLSMSMSHKTFTELIADVQRSLGSPERFFHIFPGSLMSGLVHRPTLMQLEKQWKDYMVTWKADGQRVLVVRHQKHGWFVIPSKFNRAFEVAAHLLPPAWLAIAPTDADLELGVVTHVFDAELVCVSAPAHGEASAPAAPTVASKGSQPPSPPPVYRMFIFDVLRFTGWRGSMLPFSDRLRFLSEFAKRSITSNESSAENTPAAAAASSSSSEKAAPFFTMKEYVPVAAIRTLLLGPKPPFPTDGVVFQPSRTTYKRGEDERILKWKPREQSSADFRLSKGRQETDSEWRYVPSTVVREENAAGQMVSDERALQGSIVVVPATLQQELKLCDGVIAECITSGSMVAHISDELFYANAAGEGDGKTSSSPPPGSPPPGERKLVWSVLRTRPDKLAPNRLEIATFIRDLQHLSAAELVDSLEKILRVNVPAATATGPATSYGRTAAPTAASAASTARPATGGQTRGSPAAPAASKGFAVLRQR